MEKEVSVKEVFQKILEIRQYLFSKWKLIVFFGLLSGALGLLISIFSEINYEAKISFVLEEQDSKSGGGLASLASTFGVGGIGGSSGLFSSSNMIEFFKSRKMIEKTLLLPYTDSKRKKQITFAQRFIEINDFDNNWKDSEIKELHKMKFYANEDRSNFSIVKDSILGLIYLEVLENEFSISQPNEDNSILVATYKSKDQLFAKDFLLKLIDEVSAYYTKTKTQKAKISVDVLQKQVDSVKSELFSSLTGVATATDQVFGLNPAMNIQRVPSSKKQVDVQANSAVLAELVKNLELSKMNLLNETPFIETIDQPILPLEEIKIGKVKGIVFGGFFGGFLIISFLLFRRYLDNIRAK